MKRPFDYLLRPKFSKLYRLPFSRYSSFKFWSRDYHVIITSQKFFDVNFFTNGYVKLRNVFIIQTKAVKYVFAANTYWKTHTYFLFKMGVLSRIGYMGARIEIISKRVWINFFHFKTSTFFCKYFFRNQFFRGPPSSKSEKTNKLWLLNVYAGAHT